MTGIQQGTNDGQRVGNSVSLESMQSKYRIKWGAGTDGEIRHIIFTSKNNQYGSNPTPAQILQDATTPITNMVSPLNKLNRYDYRIIKMNILHRIVINQLNIKSIIIRLR